MSMYLHELVAQEIPNPEGHIYIEHINGNLLDNRRANLRWTSVKPENYPENCKAVKKYRNKNMSKQQKIESVYKVRG